MSRNQNTTRHSQNPPRHSREGGNPVNNANKPNINNLITDNLDIWTTAIQSKSRTGRGSNKIYELYGIKKLRELILDLAVRGLLVPQDPNDEPASELLKKIAIEKEQLIKDGKIKKQKPLPKIKEEEKPFDLPEGWEWQRLGRIGFTQTGGTPKKSNTHHYGKFLPFIKPGDIIDGRIKSYLNDGLSQIGAEQLGRIAPPDSVLMVCIGTIGKSARVDRSVSFNQQINSVTPFAKIGHYIEKVLQASYFQKTAWDRSSSTTLSILNKGKWELIPIAIAPEEEQKLIVAKVDELMAICDQLEQQTDSNIKAHKLLVENLLNALTQAKDHKTFHAAWQRIAIHFDTLFTTEHSIDQLKQTILQLAVMGKLVPQNPKDEPASELLKKIAKEKEELIKEGKIKKQKALPEISEEEKPFELPEGWMWSRIKNIGYDFGQQKPEETFTYIDVSSINKNLGVVESPKTIRPENAPSRARKLVKKGTVIYSTVRPYLLNIAVIKKEFQPLPIASTAFAVIHPLNGINGSFVYRYLRSPFFVSYVENVQSGIAYPAINDQKFFNGLIVIPPTQEQNLIVAKVDELMDLCDQMKSQITSSKKIQTIITDSLMIKLFGIQTKSKQEKEVKINMKILTNLSVGDNHEFNDKSLASIIKKEGGSADAKLVWSRSKLELPEFYKKLKQEIDKGFIYKPAKAMVENT